MLKNKCTAFLKVAETGNITKSAEDLGYTQPGMSHIITNLEDELGIRLFYRRKTGVTLTTTGEMLLPYFKSIVKEIEKLESKVKEIEQTDSGIIRIASITTITANYMPQVITKFKEQYPNIYFDIVDCTEDEVEECISSGKADLGFLPRQEENRFESFPWLTDELVAVSAKSSPISDKDTLCPQDFIGQNLLLVDKTDDNIRNFFSEKLDELVPSYNILRSTYALMKMIQAGLGIGIVSTSIANTHDGELNVYKLSSNSSRTIYGIYKSKAALSPATIRFINFLKNVSV